VSPNRALAMVLAKHNRFHTGAAETLWRQLGEQSQTDWYRHADEAIQELRRLGFEVTPRDGGQQ
jgi:hypothetical protein